jgi:Eukaryotic aspartyl protease
MVLTTVDFETGISEFFIPGLGCQGCTNHTQYNPASSKSSINLKKNFTWLSADGSSVKGGLYADTIRFGGLTVHNQIFGAGTNVTKDYWLYTFPTDGLLGFGFPEASSFNATPVFHNLIKQGQVSRPEFAIKLSDEPGSELTLGGVNQRLYKGPFYYSPITKKVCHDWTLFYNFCFHVQIVGTMANRNGLSPLEWPTYIECDTSDCGFRYQASHGRHQECSFPYEQDPWFERW